MISFLRKQQAVACITLFVSLSPPQSYADGTGKAKFNATFLKNVTGLNTDVTRFSTGNPVEPGKYLLDTYLNGESIGTEEIRAIQTGDGVKTCFPCHLLKKIPLKKERLAAEKRQLIQQEQRCVSFAELFDHGEARLNTADLRLDITLPQADLIRQPRGYVDPEIWQKGANALNLNYSLNAYRSVTRFQQYDSVYARSLLGLNFNGWMLRHDGAFNWQKQSDNNRYYENIATYVQKDISPLKSRLLLGEGNTSGDLFDTLSFRGAQLASVDMMLPESLRGYAPQIRGVADTTAQVTVRQNGTKIYETTVSPGAFQIDDLYPASYGGDLAVTIKEADGSEKHFSVPSAAVAKLKRPGISSWTVTAGVSRIDNLVYRPKIIQATVQHGINNTFSGYAGVQGTDNATSLLLGTAIGLPIGALSADVTSARAEYGDQKKQGLKLRATYSKRLVATDTSITLTATRSSADYLSYSDAVYLNNSEKKGGESRTLSRVRERLSLSAIQRLGARYGSLYASGYRQNYWNKSGTNTQFQLGYSGIIGKLTYSLSANRLFYADSPAETAFTLNLSLPLGNGANGHHHYFTASATRSRESVTAQSSLSGTLGRYSYNVSVSGDNASQYAGSLSGQYKSPWTSLQMGYTKGDSYYSASGGLSGSMILLPGSLTLSPYKTSTLALVSAENAKGASVFGYPDIILDGSGHAIVPNLSPYKINELSLDPSGLPVDVELTQTSQRVVPIEGAIMKVDYKSVSGQPVLLRATLADGTPLPFGARVSDENGNTLTTVMQAGQIYLRLKQDKARLRVLWENNSCEIIPDADKLKKSAGGSLKQLNTKCT